MLDRLQLNHQRNAQRRQRGLQHQTATRLVTSFVDDKTVTTLMTNCTLTTKKLLEDVEGACSTIGIPATHASTLQTCFTIPAAVRTCSCLRLCVELMVSSIVVSVSSCPAMKTSRHCEDHVLTPSEHSVSHEALPHTV